MPLKIMLYVSLLLPANILLVKRISNIPMTIFSLFVFFSFLWWRSGNKKERHVYLHQAATGMLHCQEQAAWASVGGVRTQVSDTYMILAVFVYVSLK